MMRATSSEPNFCRLDAIRQRCRASGGSKILPPHTFQDGVKEVRCTPRYFVAERTCQDIRLLVAPLNDFTFDGGVLAPGSMLPVGFIEEINAESDGVSVKVTPMSGPEGIAEVMEQVYGLQPNEVDVLFHFIPPHAAKTRFNMSHPETAEFYDRLHQLILRVLVGQLGVGNNWVIADPGCADGVKLASLIAKHTGAHVYASDISREVALAVVRNQISSVALNAGRVSVDCYPVQEIDQQHDGEPFDLVIASGLFNLQVMDNERDVLSGLEAIWRALKPGGRLLLTGKSPLLVRSHELAYLGFHREIQMFPNWLFTRMGLFPEQFYLMQKVEDRFGLTEGLEIFREMEWVRLAG